MVAHRPERVPLFVPVVTSAPLVECWTENISTGGARLSARAVAGAPLGVGGTISLQLTLPDGSPVDVSAEVVWVEDEAQAGLALGVRFVSPDDGVLAPISRLTSQRPHTVVGIGLDAAAGARLVHALRGLVEVVLLEPGASPGPLNPAVIVCGTNATHARTEDAPRVVLAGPAAETSASLRAGLSSGAIDLRPELDGGEPDDHVARVVLSAVRDFSGRVALRRTALRLARALHAAQLEPRRRVTRRDDEPPDSSALIALDPRTRAALAAVDVVARRKVVVLLLGETGAGKELFAKTVHARSDRAHRPYVVQDCGTLTETLLESELFGHVKGAFTGAIADNPGVFVNADGGTVFLDEIQNTSAALQAKLLRVIETGEVRPVGGSRTRVTDVRIIAAANVDLEAAVAAGRFRADLYYRLTVFPIRLPPLRERPADLAPLVRRMVSIAAAAHRIETPVVSTAALDAIRAYSWPGNIRELKNALERAVLLAADDGEIKLAHLPDAVQEMSSEESMSLEERLAHVERAIIKEALDAADGVLSRAAASLRTNRVTLARRARALGLTE